jgi:SAM-dependent methyltransferase
MTQTEQQSLKTQVQEFWDKASCGEVYATGESEKAQYEAQAEARYTLEPYLKTFAQFPAAAGKDVLEIGVGMGADHLELAKAGPRTLSGVDLTPRAIEHTHKRLDIYGLPSELRVGDAENLPFQDNAFDLVYSWGVIHHSPNTAKAVQEIWRVLRPGGTARVMIYHKYAITGYLLWLRYALLRGKPNTSLDAIYHDHLESPGTKAYSVAQAREMFGTFNQATFRVQLSLGDLLEGAVGQRHQSGVLKVLKAIWPRPLIKAFFKNHGLCLLIEATK